LDTTLRDGAQMADVDFSLADKRHIAALLDGLGSITSRAVILAPIRSTRNFSRKSSSCKALASRPSA